MSELTTIDKRLLRYAAYKSPEEISELLNGVVSPVEVASRVMELLRSRDWLSTLQKKQLLTDRLWELTDTYWDYASQGSIKSAEIVLKSLKEVRSVLDEDRINIEEAMTRITTEHGQQMGKAIAASFEMLLKELESRDIKIDAKDADEILLKVLKPAFTSIEEITDHD